MWHDLPTKTTIRFDGNFKFRLNIWILPYNMYNKIYYVYYSKIKRLCYIVLGHTRMQKEFEYNKKIYSVTHISHVCRTIIFS